MRICHRGSYRDSKLSVYPGLIVFRESGLTIDEQWTRLERAITIVREEENQGRDHVNRAIEVFSSDHRVIRDLPP